MAKKQCCADRLNKVGGQAVLEGVMMKAGTRTVTTCRKSDGTLVVTDGEFHSKRKKNKLLNLPIIRGVINMIEMLKLSIDTLSASADALGLDEEDEKTKARREKREAKRIAKGKAPKKKKKNSSITDGVMVVSMFLGVLLAVGLFIVLPVLIGKGVDNLYLYVDGMMNPDRFARYLHEVSSFAIPLIEGVAKVVIFVLYLSLTSLLKDIRRTFMYHGAEHKSIACFEAGEELTPENAKKHRRFHPRCGTSFMFVMILLGIVAGIIIHKLLGPTFSDLFGNFDTVAMIGTRILILPLLVGIGYEFIMFAGKHDNFITRALSAPGLWMQRITTKEPTEKMLEVAIVSIKCALRDEYPEFKKFYDERGWETKKAPVTETPKEEGMAKEASEENKAEIPAENVGCTDEPTEASAEATATEITATEITDTEAPDKENDTEKCAEDKCE